MFGGPSGEFRVSEEGHRKLWPHLPYYPTRIVFGYAENPDSLEAITAKAALLDECGQKSFKLQSFEALRRRISLNKGRALLTSTPYTNLHWLKTEVYDKFLRRGTDREERDDSEFDVVSFESIMNPAFPMEEWEREQRIMPKWKFDLFYRGKFTMPAGAIYDCFDRAVHVCKPFAINPHWPTYVGVDFGGANTAAIFFSENPADGKMYAFREYHPNSGGDGSAQVPISEHARRLLAIIPSHNKYVVGGAKSEQQWRTEFTQCGLHILTPDQPDVEVGLTRVYEALKTGRITFFDTCPRTIDSMMSYSRKIDDLGNVTDDIDDKAKFHLPDAVRYIISWVMRPKKGPLVG
jgi:hypothetical protein